MIDNSPEVDNYFALIDELNKLEALQQDAVDVVRPTIDAAIDAASTRVEELRSDGSVSNFLIQVAAEAQQTLAQIDALQSSVDLGLIPQEVLDAQKEAVLSDPRVTHAIEHVATLGILDTVVTVESIVEDSSTNAVEIEAASAEVERKYPDIKITVRGDGVQIGGKGKFIKLSKAYAKGQKDYSEERLAILKVLVEHAGEEVPVRELWDEALPGIEFDRESMRQVRLWLDTLTYRRSPIVSHNGGRANSAYRIDNPNVTIEEVYRTEPAQRKVSEQEEIQAAQVTDQPSQPSELVDLPEAVNEEPEVSVKTVEKPKKQVLFPLSHVESVILAEFLTFNKELLQKLEMPVPADHIADQLQSTIKEPSRYVVELHQYGGDITEARRAILNKVISYFAPENDDQIFDDLVNMEELDNRYELFEYLFEFEQEQREFLLEKLVDSLPVTVVTEAGGSFSAGVTVIDVETFRVDGSGQRIDQFVQEAEGSVDIAVSGQFEEGFAADDSIVVSDLTEEGVSIDVVEPVIDSPELVADEQIETGKDDVDEHESENWLKDIEDQAKEVIQQFEADGLMVEGSKIERKLVFTKSFSRLAGTETMMERAVGNGIIKRNQINQPLSIDKFICMMLQNANPQAFSHRRRTKQVVALVESLVNDYFKAQRQQN